MFDVSGNKLPPLPELIALYVHRRASRLRDALREGYTQETLLGRLKDSEAETRKAAAYALSLIGAPSAGIPVAAGLHAEDPVEHFVVEQSLWRLWFRSGREEVDALLHEGVRLMESKRPDAARVKFDRVIARAPEFPEGYNQRAIACYMMDEWKNSIADCERAITLNPVHFGAFAGMGHCYLQLRRADAALAAYERALAINPRMEDIRRRADRLRELLGGDEQLA